MDRGGTGPDHQAQQGACWRNNSQWLTRAEPRSGRTSARRTYEATSCLQRGKGRPLLGVLAWGKAPAGNSGSGWLSCPHPYSASSGWNGGTDVATYLRRQGRPARCAGSCVRRCPERSIPSLLSAIRPSSPSASSFGGACGTSTTPNRLAGHSPATNSASAFVPVSLGQHQAPLVWVPATRGSNGNLVANAKDDLRGSIQDIGQGMCHSVTTLRGPADAGGQLWPLSWPEADRALRLDPLPRQVPHRPTIPTRVRVSGSATPDADVALYVQVNDSKRYPQCQPVKRNFACSSF